MNEATLVVPAERRGRVDAVAALDEATRVLYLRLRSEERNRALIEAIESGEAPPLQAVPGLRIVLVPGILYREYPETGADGSELRKVAERLGLPFDIIPLKGTEGIDAAAAYIEEWLLRLPADSRVLLFTLSKGTAEVRHSLSRESAGHSTQAAFRRVHAWVSISGSPLGSPQFELVMNRRIPSTIFRALFWWRRWNLTALRDVLRHRPNGPFVLPAHIEFVQIVPFPLQVHLRDRRSMRFRKRLAAFGPNDGFTVLDELAALPGSIYPVWGADHYMRGLADLPGHLARLIAFVTR